MQLLQRAEKKQRDEMEQRTALKRSGLGHQLDQRRQVWLYMPEQLVSFLFAIMYTVCQKDQMPTIIMP